MSPRGTSAGFDQRPGLVPVLCCGQEGPCPEELQRWRGHVTNTGRQRIRSQETWGFLLAQSPAGTGLCITTNKTLRMDIPSSDILGKTQRRIKAARDQVPAYEETADGLESPAEQGAVTRAFMGQMPSLPTSLLHPLPLPFLMTQPQSHPLREACLDSLRLSVTPFCSG